MPRPDADADLPREGDVIDGKYRVEGVIGGGGMGVVLAAHHELLDQRVAVKVLTARDSTALARFSLEARSTARLKNEHVARVMDVGALPTGAPFLVLEYLEGCDLEELLELNGRLPVDDAVDYVLQALEGLAHAHALGIIHRDLKPANLFLAVQPSGANLIKILDFGISESIASRRSGKTGMTGDHATLGSPRYMSPEQIRSTKDVDARSDVWSIGVVLFELLSGRLPFSGESFGETFAAILETEAPSLASVCPGAPAALVDAVRRCMKRDRGARFADVLELARAIGPFGLPESAARVTRIEQTLRNAGPIAEGRLPVLPNGRERAGPDAETLDEPPEQDDGGDHVTLQRPRTPQMVTGHVAFTSDTPIRASQDTTSPSNAKRSRKRSTALAVGAAAILITAGAGAAATVIHRRAAAAAALAEGRSDVTAAPATPAVPAPAQSEPQGVAIAAASEDVAPASPATGSPPSPPPPRPSRAPARALERPKPAAHAPPAPAHHAPPPSPKKRPSVLDSPDRSPPMRLHLRDLLRIAALVGSLSVTGRARAGDAPPAADAVRARADAEFEDAKKLMDAGQTAAACAEFAHSQQLDPKLGRLLNLAFCHETEGKTASAWREYNDAAALAEQKGQSERVDFARERAAAVAKKLVLVHLELPPDAASVQVDGAPLPHDLWSVPLPLDPGEHVVQVSAPAKRALTKSVVVGTTPGVQPVVVPALEAEVATPPAPPPAAPAPVAPPAAPPTPAPDAARGTSGTLVPAFVAGAIAVAGVGVGIGFGLDASSKKSDADPHCPNKLCDPTGSSLISDARTSATVSTVGFVVGIAGAAAATWLFVRPPGEHAATARVTPLFDGRMAGAIVEATW